MGLVPHLQSLIGVAMAQLESPRQAHLHQEIQSAVHGGALKAGDFVGDTGAEFVGGRVSRALQQSREDQPALGCEPLPLLAQRLQAVHGEMMIAVGDYCNKVGRATRQGLL